MGKYTLSDKAREQRARAGAAPRKPEYAELRRLMHELLDPVMISHAFPRLSAILQSEDTPPELWLRAFEISADRLGLPRMMQHQLGISGFTIIKADELGWPVMEVASQDTESTDAPSVGDGARNGDSTQH